MSIMDQVKTNLREWYSLAADRTGEMAKISVRMYDKYGISREIERQLSELGSYVYHAVDQGRTEFAADSEFEAWIERIKALESDLDAKVDEIEGIRLARQQKQTAREQTAEPVTSATDDVTGEVEELETQEAGPLPEAGPVAAAKIAGETVDESAPGRADHPDDTDHSDHPDGSREEETTDSAPTDVAAAEQERRQSE